MSESSTPTFSDFNPDIIPYQRRVIRLVKKEFDYSQGTLEVLLSGSVGSAKSILAAHLAVMHCLEFKNARCLIGRKALPDLKDTIFMKILEHLEGTLVEKKHYWINQQRASIKFINGSEIISRSWSDRKYKKIRSIELSAAIIEELTENDEKDKSAYDEIKMRVGRLPHVKENFIICPTNPDAPSHWAYQYFMLGKKPTRHVFYSVTTDNPFLPESYIRQLKEDLDPKLAQRMIYGKWIELTTEVIYYEYDAEKNYRDYSYEIDPLHPVWLSFDFNIGLGKPLSAVLMQYVDDTFHIFAEVVVEGMRTQDALEELENRGLLDLGVKYMVAGDATGKRRDTRSKRSDWDIINKYLANYKSPNARRLAFELAVGVSNPRIRDRHNIVNAYCHNSEGKRRLFVYKDCPVANQGMRLTKLKPGAHLIEDDSEHYQHITTAIGYAICAQVSMKNRKKQGTVRL